MRTHWTILTTFVLLSLLFLAGCSRASREESTADVQIELTAIPFPAVVGESRLVIRVTHADGRPIDDARLSIKGDMTHAGMEPVLAETSGGTDGYYEAPFEWTMGGDWVVTVEAQLADGSMVRERFDLAVATEAELCTDE